MRPESFGEDGTPMQPLNKKVGTPEVGGEEPRQPIPVLSIELKSMVFFL